MKKFLTVLALSFATIFVLTACAPAASPINVSQETVIIDVRTPAEYSAGHLDGAVNIDLQSADFATAIMQLPLDGDYVLYCKSGNRAGQALTQMENMGFTTIVNAGSVADASRATGIAIVQ